MNVSETDLWVVLRYSGERSLPLAHKALRDQTHRFTVIEEYPYTQAMLKTFEIGIEKKTPYLLALDADLILNPGALNKILQETKKAFERNPNLFFLNFSVSDKFVGKIAAGCHVYNNAYSSQIHTQLSKMQANEKGFPLQLAEALQLAFTSAENDPIGLHDYAQYYAHIYSKSYRFAKRCTKNLPLLVNAEKSIRGRLLLQPDDFDFVVALYGLIQGEKNEDIPFDARFYPPLEKIEGLNEFIQTLYHQLHLATKIPSPLLEKPHLPRE